MFCVEVEVKTETDIVTIGTVNMIGVERKTIVEAVHLGTISLATAVGPNRHVTPSLKKIEGLDDVQVLHFHVNGKSICHILALVALVVLKCLTVHI